MPSVSRRNLRRKSKPREPNSIILDENPVKIEAVPETEQPIQTALESGITELSTTYSTKCNLFNPIRRWMTLIWDFFLGLLLQVIMLPLLPLKHLPSKTYIRRVNEKSVSGLKRELRALERELEAMKRRNSTTPKVQSDLLPKIATPLPPPPPPPPAPPAMAPPPPPPPPPPAPPLFKQTVKPWRVSTDTSSNSDVPANRSKSSKPAVPKRGFDISVDQIAQLAKGLRKVSSTTAVPTSNTAKKYQTSPKSSLSDTLRATLKTRRSSLLQEDKENSNSANTQSDSPKFFKAVLRKAPVQTSPGGTPLRPPTTNTSTHMFNTALADKHVGSSPLRNNTESSAFQ